MSVLGYRARNHPQQVRASGARADVDDRATSWEDFGPLHSRFAFTVDAAASPHNALRTEFLPGRLQFIAAGKPGIGPNERPPFGCCLLIWGTDVPPPAPVSCSQPELFGGEVA